MTQADTIADVVGHWTDDENNRRQRPRMPYDVMQRVAACTDGKIPPLNTFQQVRCHDLSQSGISFDSQKPLLDEYVVVELGRGTDVLYVRAKVCNSMRMTAGSSAYFRIGCEFVNRLEPTA